MKNLNQLNSNRITGKSVNELYGWAGDHSCGAFEFGPLRVIASAYEGWDHVSVSCLTRCPNWEEMAKIKRLFFEDSETAIQIHPPEDEYVNTHPFCLHLWRPHFAQIPLPPTEMVGPKK